MLGKLSPAQIKAFLAIAEKAEGEFAEIREQVIANPAVLEVVGKNLFAWGEYYRLPPNVQSAFVMRQFGLGDLFKKAALQENIPDALLDLAGMEIPDEWVETKEQREAVQQRLSFALGMYFSLQSVFYYGKWMHELLEAGDDRSLLQAISVDPVATGSQVVQERLATAVFLKDAKFVKAYMTALKGPSEKINKQINRVRLVAKMLQDAKMLPMPEKDLIRLFCDELKIYPSTGSPAKALKKIIKVVTPTPVT